MELGPLESCQAGLACVYVSVKQAGLAAASSPRRTRGSSPHCSTPLLGPGNGASAEGAGHGLQRRFIALAGRPARRGHAARSAAHARGAERPHPPPGALAVAEWLVGDWVGTGIEGAEASEAWLPPSAGAMVGVLSRKSRTAR